MGNNCTQCCCGANDVKREGEIIHSNPTIDLKHQISTLTVPEEGGNQQRPPAFATNQMAMFDEQALREERAAFLLEMGASIYKDSENQQEADDSDKSSVCLTEQEEELDKLIGHQELQILVKKLHRFAKLQLAKLAHESGVVNDKLNKQLHVFMRRSLKVIKSRHETTTQNKTETTEETNLVDFQNNIDQMIGVMNDNIRQREETRFQRGICLIQPSLRRKLSDPRHFRYSKELLCTMTMQELGFLLCCLLPIARLGENKYMIGSEAKQIVVKQTNVLIRTGGGYCPIEEHIHKYALSECLVILRMMQQKHLTFNETVVTLLELHSADEELINHYLEETTDEISELYEVIGTLVKQKQQEKYLIKEKPGSAQASHKQTTATSRQASRQK